MSKSFFGFALVSLSLVACAAQTSDGDESTGQTAQAQSVMRPGESCHSNNGVVFGTINQYGWCCGVSRCDDPQTCGDDYGKYRSSCANCTATAEGVSCDSGPFREGDPGTYPTVTAAPRPTDKPPPGPRK